MATAMLDHVDRFFGLPASLFYTSCSADLGAGEAEGPGAGLIYIVRDHPLFMNTTAKNNSSRERRPFIGVKNYFKGLGVAILLGCCLN